MWYENSVFMSYEASIMLWYTNEAYSVVQKVFKGRSIKASHATHKFRYDKLQKNIAVDINT